jgi:hypothetical protein
VDPFLTLAVIIKESGCKLDIPNSNRGAVGLMQITKGTFTIVCSSGSDSFDDMQNPQKNIACGVKILNNYFRSYGDGVKQTSTYKSNSDFKKIVDECINKGYFTYLTYTGWNAALRAYNGWGCGSTADTDYVEKVNNLYNELKRLSTS